ncbi:MAG: efflux RND transporter periplasmic adaptor subunit [Candidatus Aureabacteria bacterium]|nr:efflux RND transporter periplasmic adaptor subunit [Candidatus Auribacterota bacterium]
MSTRCVHNTALLALILLALFPLPACKKASPAPPPTSVVAMEVIQKDVPLESEWIGTALGYIDAQIRPKVQGYLLEQNYGNGALVKKDQLLFTIDPRQFQADLDQAEGQLHKAQAALQKSDIDVTRYTPLSKEGAVSQEELDQVIQGQQSNQAMVDSAEAGVRQARLNLDWTTVLSPIDGIAGISAAQIGDLVSEQTVLTAVSQVNPIKVQFPISEQEYLAYAEHRRSTAAGDAAPPKFDLGLVLADESVYPEPGQLLSIDRQIDIKTGTMLVQAAFPNPGNLLRPGQYAKIRAVTRVAKGALLIPQRAVQEVQSNYQVAVVTAQGTVNFQPVTPGERVGDLWIITQGLQKGDRVVVEGLQKLKQGMPVNAQMGSPPPTPAPSSAAAAK